MASPKELHNCLYYVTFVHLNLQFRIITIVFAFRHAHVQRFFESIHSCWEFQMNLFVVFVHVRKNFANFNRIDTCLKLLQVLNAHDRPKAWGVFD